MGVGVQAEPRQSIVALQDIPIKKDDTILENRTKTNDKKNNVLYLKRHTVTHQ